MLAWVNGPPQARADAAGSAAAAGRQPIVRRLAPRLRLRARLAARPEFCFALGRPYDLLLLRCFAFRIPLRGRSLLALPPLCLRRAGISRATCVAGSTSRLPWT